MSKILWECISLAIITLVLSLSYALLWYTLGMQLLFSIVVLLSPFFFRKKWYKWFYIIYKTLPRDLKMYKRFAIFIYHLKKIELNNTTVEESFSKHVNKHPDKICFYFEDTKWTFKEVDEYSNKIARYFKDQGYIKGDSVSLLLENRPEYACIWLGLSKIGVITSFININLVQQPLIHCINISNSKGLIFGSDFINNIKNIKDNLTPNLKYYQFNTSTNVDLLPESIDLKNTLVDISGSHLRHELIPLNVKDKMVYIYTSGTTGLPKAAVVTPLRFFILAMAVFHVVNLRYDDIVYISLPMYHSSGLIGTSLALSNGLTVVIRRKFSASNFWKDCIKYNCTAAQYIGDLCRYLLTVPPSEVDKCHKVRILFGNGLRTKIWNNFVQRFNIKEIVEFYGSTEGNSSLVNIEGIPGAIGFKPRYLGDLYPLYLLKFNEETNELERDQNGFCIKCEINQPGLLVGKINKKLAISDFDGYVDIQETKKKVLENVFTNGDRFFNSGDVLIMDELGYFYFKDRKGDTFRWKGENVATTEVESVISNIIGMKDVAVYGVEIPHAEGRCGMAAIVDQQNSVNLKDLAVGLRKNLPSYACPLFIRIMDSIPLTGTFKIKKFELQKEAFDVNKIKDKIYFYDSKVGEFVPLNQDLYNDIIEERVRV